MIFLGEDMRRLLNTIYVTNEAAYLTLDGENLNSSGSCAAGSVPR